MPLAVFALMDGQRVRAEPKPGAVLKAGELVLLRPTAGTAGTSGAAGVTPPLEAARYLHGACPTCEGLPQWHYVGLCSPDDRRRVEGNEDAAARVRADVQKWCEGQHTETHYLRVRFSVRREVLYVTTFFTAFADPAPLRDWLGKRYQTRVRTNLVSARDMAAATGGVGICGRTLCCSLGMCKAHPAVSTNDPNACGVCGRIRCCMAFE